MKVCAELNSVPQIHVHSEPLSVYLFGKRVFANVTMLRWQTGLQWVLNPVTDVLIRRGEFGH